MRATAETLVRCASVCKYWYSIISHPTFIETHLNHQKTLDLLIVRTCPIESQKELYSWHCDNVAFTVCGQQPPMDIPGKNFYLIAGSCNGLLCLADGHPAFVDDMFLWNPAIRMWLKLPPQPITSNPRGQYEQAIGFGFDAASNDYKVIRIIHHMIDFSISTKVFVYSLSSGNWKTVGHLAGELEHLSFRQEVQAFINGATHWIAYDKITHRYIVLSFHLSDEVFRRIELPTGSSCFRPIVIEGLLSVVESSRNTKKCCIWMMKEYGVASSWSKYLDLKFPRKSGRIIGFSKTDRVLVDVGGALYSCDPHAKDENGANQLKGLGIRSRFGNALHVESFVGSLVLFGRQRYVEDDVINVAALSLNTE